MDENELNLELELINLLRNEQKKDYYTESVEKERSLIREAFYEALLEYSDMPGDLTVESLLESQGATTFDPQLIQFLEERIFPLLARHKILLSGEMRVTGKGIYTLAAENGTMLDPQILDETETMYGNITGYAPSPLASKVPGYSSGEEEYVSTMELWVRLDDVVIEDPLGDEVDRLERAFVPFTALDFTFGKVVRSEASAPIELPSPQAIDMHDYLIGSDAKELYASIENALNHNVEYDEEELEALREEYLQDLRLYMDDGMPPYGNFLLSTSEVHEIKVGYSKPIITVVEGKWRVAHEFEVLGENNQTTDTVVVLPEAIVSFTLIEN